MSDTAAHPSAGVSKKPRQEDEADREPENEDNNGAAEEDALIEEEHLVWRKNAPFLYDFVLTEELEWPSLSVQWLAPDTEGPHPEPGHTQHKLLVGTNAEPGEKNYIAIYQALLPDDDAEIEPDLDKTKTRSRFRAVCRIPHDGDVNRVRAQPGNENIIASRMADGAVGIFNTSKFGEWGLYAKQERFKDQPCDPLVRGVSHSQEGYGLDWDPLNSGRLLTCGDDGKTLLWDVTAPLQRRDKSMLPVETWSTAKVSDCQWSRKTFNMFGTSSLDGVVSLWDARQAATMVQLALSGDAQNSLAFAPLDENMLCSAGEGKIVHLWDLRAPAQPMHELKGHSEEVYQVQWSPTDDKMLASCGTDRRVILWDLDRIGEEQSPEDAEDGDPELLFIHGGHSAAVSDLAWNPHQRFVMASVAEDATVHIWEPAAHIFGEEEEAEDDEGVAVE